MSRKEKHSKAAPDVKNILEFVLSEFDFGYCSVKSNATAEIVKFFICKHENCPFLLSHESGVLAVKGKQNYFIFTLGMRINSLNHYFIHKWRREKIKLSSVFKYSLLSVSETSLDFKELLVEKLNSNAKQFKILNLYLLCWN